jgi:hypothetical protein
MAIHVFHPPATFDGCAFPSSVHEHPPHHFDCNGEEVSAIAPVHGAAGHEAHVRFVNERSALEWMAAGFPSHFSMGETAQLVIYERCQPIESVDLAVSPSSQ